MALGYSSAGAVCADASEIPLANNAVAATRLFTVTICFFIVSLLFASRTSSTSRTIMARDDAEMAIMDALVKCGVSMVSIALGYPEVATPAVV
jgi:hypothetical protein